MRPMHALGRRGSFWTAAAVAGVALWTGGAPSITYPLYAAEWHLTQAVTTSIFAVYPLVLVAVLLVAGDLSDHIGRRASILMGLTASLIGVILFAVAPNVGWIFVGRAFMGIGVGLSMSPATAAMVEFSPAGQSKRASSITTASTAMGLTLALLVGGGLIQYAPFPTRLNFWVLAFVVAAVLAVACFLPRKVGQGASGPWRPTVPHVPVELRFTVAIAALSITAAFAVGALMLSLGAQVARDLVGTSNTLVSGGVLALQAALIGGVALASTRLAYRTDMIAGGLLTAVSMALLVWSAAAHSLALFLLTSVLAGAGYSLLFLGGLTLVSSRAPAHHRGGTLSAAYLVAYLMQGAVAVGLGLVASASSLRTAIDVGAPFVALLGLAAAVLAKVAATSDRPTELVAVNRELVLGSAR